MKFKRSGAALAVLESGDEMFGVFAFGGFDGQAISAFCEVLPLSSVGLGRDKVNHRWREVHRMNVARYAASAVVLPGGEGVAVFGGFDGTKIVSSVEVFKPDHDAACSGGIGSWTTVASMPCARMSFGVCVYRGLVVVVGGGAQSGKVLKSVDVYDPAAREWIAEGADESVPDLPQGRKECMAFVIGEELWVAGGVDASDCMDTCLIYDRTRRQWQDGPPLPCVRSAAACLVL